MKKTTKKQFNEFKAECTRLQELLGLKEYELYYELIPLSRGKIAQATTDAEGLVATITLATEYPEDEPSDWHIGCAKHEMVHVLMSRLEWLAFARFLTPDDIYHEMEVIARRLERLI